MMSRAAWSLATTGTTPEIYYFEVNPKADGGSLGVSKSPTYAVAAGYSGKTVVHETTDEIARVQYSGVLLTPGQNTSISEWYLKEEPLILTDDLGQSALVYLDSLEFTRAPKRAHPNRMEFSFTGYVLEVL